MQKKILITTHKFSHNLETWIDNIVICELISYSRHLSSTKTVTLVTMLSIQDVRELPGLPEVWSRSVVI